MNIFRVIEPGLFTTIQDKGRIGFRSIGVPQSGCADHLAFFLANKICGNDSSSAVLEITYIGPKLECLKDTIISITGADLSPQINSCKIPMWESVSIKKGEFLSFRERRWGCRSYLAVAGGFQTDDQFGSKSTDVRSGLFGKFILENDILPCANDRTVKISTPHGFNKSDILEFYNPLNQLEVVLGPEKEYFDANGFKILLSKEFIVSSKSDRIGIRLSGAVVEQAKKDDMPSVAVVQGNIQIPPNGNPIILGPDCQTVGGYPRIATVITADFPKLAQLFTNDKVRFIEVTMEKALLRLRKQSQFVDFKF
jgi:biotin-dependent carboxylase-like uncharacterized protein